MDTLKYENESDKCHGVAGMMLSLLSNDGEDCLSGIDLDAEDGPMTFAPEFYFSGNPVLSAKIAWSQMLSQYRLVSGMIVSNVMCRSYVIKHKVLDKSGIELLRKILRDGGKERCELEEDECDRILDRHMEIYDRLYRSAEVHNLVGSFVKMLAERRRLSPSEAFEFLGR